MLLNKEKIKRNTRNEIGKKKIEETDNKKKIKNREISQILGFFEYWLT
jgi:hypothetical protein